jgi:UDP-N-acetyl-D-mannosaminuronate dehydrogenase
MNISFIGLGKLGLPLATNFAKNGHKVIGIDLNLQLLQLLNENIAPWH